MPTQKRAMVLIDGENLLFRFQDMLRPDGKIQEGVTHSKDRFVWTRRLAEFGPFDVLRVAYYTSIVGSDDVISQLQADIAKQIYRQSQETSAPYVQVVPFVFRRLANARKTRIVDAHITVDALRHAHSHDVQVIYLVAGDGDYLPVAIEAMRSGVEFWIGALSSGVEERLKYTVDRFVALDDHFFVRQ